MIVDHTSHLKTIAMNLKNITFPLIFICILGFVGQAFAAPGPTEQLKPTLDNLVELIVDPDLKGDENKEERRNKIMDAIKGGFDFREMSKRVLGKTWNTISPEERDYFTELMTELLENAYIGKLENYSGQKVEFLDEKIKGKRAQITTYLENNGIQIPVHYIMKRKSEKWMVYDINIEGVSLIRNYMQQFKSIVRRDKFEGLVKVLEEKNRSF